MDTASCVTTVGPCRWTQLVPTQCKQQIVLTYRECFSKHGGHSHLRSNDLLKNSHEGFILITGSEVRLRQAFRPPRMSTCWSRPINCFTDMVSIIIKVKRQSDLQIKDSWYCASYSGRRILCCSYGDFLEGQTSDMIIVFPRTELILGPIESGFKWCAPDWRALAV